MGDIEGKGELLYYYFIDESTGVDSGHYSLVVKVDSSIYRVRCDQAPKGTKRSSIITAGEFRLQLYY